VDAIPKNRISYRTNSSALLEQKVAKSLKAHAQALGFADRLGRVLIPTEEVLELWNGKKMHGHQRTPPLFQRHRERPAFEAQV
jgi:transcription antitermination factor NusG